MSERIDVPKSTEIRSWTVEIPPAYQRACDYIHHQVFDRRRGAYHYDFATNTYTVHLVLEEMDKVVVPVLTNIHELWLVAKANKEWDTYV